MCQPISGCTLVVVLRRQSALHYLSAYHTCRVCDCRTMWRSGDFWTGELGWIARRVASDQGNEMCTALHSNITYHVPFSVFDLAIPQFSLHHSVRVGFNECLRCPIMWVVLLDLTQSRYLSQILRMFCWGPDPAAGRECDRRHRQDVCWAVCSSGLTLCFVFTYWAEGQPHLYLHQAAVLPTFLRLYICCRGYVATAAIVSWSCLIPLTI